MKHSLWIAVCLMLMESALVAATINYSVNFKTWDWDVPLTTSATSDSRTHYWYQDTGSFFGGTGWYNPGPDFDRWLVTNAAACDGNAYRNFRTAGELTAGTSIANATLTAYTCQGSGLDTDANLYVRLSLLDPAGNGYVGTVTRTGAMDIYESMAGTLTRIKTGSSGQSGNAKYCTLSAINGVVTFSYYYVGSESTVYTTSVADDTYNAFTTLGLGAHFSYSENQGFNNVTLTGTIVPEPAAAGLLAVAGALVMARRRKR